ncbi:MAG: tRNA threonylcarbamoyladenosine dehydratase, partial [Acutalibacteraceae bacterium]|nr:tRNA threonylcarbamoyladenosine dehydratase [Acutalibacteraceae bacterium]
DSLKVVYSEEEPMTPLQPASEDPVDASPEEPPKRRKDTPGSISFVPSVAGLILAGEVVKDLTGVRNDKA